MDFTGAGGRCPGFRRDLPVGKQRFHGAGGHGASSTYEIKNGELALHFVGTGGGDTPFLRLNNHTLELCEGDSPRSQNLKISVYGHGGGAAPRPTTARASTVVLE